MNRTTIVAAATAMVAQPIGIIRISGPDALNIAKKLTRNVDLKPRAAHFVSIYGEEIIDQAVVIYFKAPYSFTGEDIVEFQLHGNPYVKQQVIDLCCKMGASLARAGEFSERAFLNGKMSLDQVEAVADIIHANSEQAAKSAALSLSGVLKEKVALLQAGMMELRVLIEAGIDFTEEDIPSITQKNIAVKLLSLKQQLNTLLITAKQGVKLQSGIKIALAGRPNVGKSTLMNAICQHDVSIVTDEAGTTRDVVVREVIHKGVCLSFSDTAGIRDTESLAEKMGIKKAQEETQSCDLILHICDGGEGFSIKGNTPVWHVRNKADIASPEGKAYDFLISAKHNAGVDKLLDAIVERFQKSDAGERPFSARARQVDVLERASAEIKDTCEQHPLEIIAQNLFQTQSILSEITGEITTDDVLGEIFSEFCIGK